MKIVFRHPCSLPVSAYGGTERFLFWLMKGLSELGQEVLFIGHGSSSLGQYGIKFLDEKSVVDWRELIPKDTDIVHLSYRSDEITDFPVLTTVHGNGQPGEVFHKNTVFVSKSHAHSHGAKAFIHNALDPSEYPESFYIEKIRTLEDIKTFLFLAKASWRVKNLKGAMKIVKKTGRHLNLIGGKTFLPRSWVTSYGFKGGEEKLRIIGQSDALLFPVKWNEPFGIAIIEAMLLGLPVFGSKFGSLNELIHEGVGKTFQNKTECIDYFLGGGSNSYDSKAIRQYVLDNFHYKDQAKKYFESYEKVLSGELLNDSHPERDLNVNPVGLYDF
ncbi:MAG: glycosyltransferase [Bacteriovoracaceae bacterium]